MVNGEETSEKATAFRFGQMELNIKGFGLTIRPRERVSSLMLMAIFMMEIGSKIKLQETVFIFTITALVIKANGLTIINMDTVSKPG